MKVDKYDKFYKIHADDGKSLCTLDGTLLGSLIVIPPNDYLIGKYIEVDSTKNLEIPQEIIEEEIKNYMEALKELLELYEDTKEEIAEL